MDEKKTEIPKFSDCGFKYVSEDGKKIFDAEKIGIGQIINIEIIVLDFEENVKNKEEKERTIFKIRIKSSGKEYKVWTGCKELIQALNYMNEKGLIPFETVIRSKPLGSSGKCSYKFS